MSSVSSGVRERKGIPLFISCHSSWCHRLPAVPCPPPWFAAPKESKKYNSRAGACTGYIEGAGCRKEGGTMYLYHRNFVFNQWCGSRSLQIRTMGDPDLGTGTYAQFTRQIVINQLPYLKPSIFKRKKIWLSKTNSCTTCVPDFNYFHRKLTFFYFYSDLDTKYWIWILF